MPAPTEKCQHPGCKGSVRSNGWCWHHDPDTAAERRARRQKQAKTQRANTAAKVKTEPKYRKPQQMLRPRNGFVEWRLNNPGALAKEAAAVFDVHPSLIGKWDRWLEVHGSTRSIADPVSMEAVGLPTSLFDVRTEHIPALVADFKAFRAKFLVTERGTAHLWAPFVDKWIEAIVTAFATGSRQLILSPPRHGKPVSVDSKILMADGSRKRLRDVSVGDRVITHMGRGRTVKKVFEQGLLPGVKITTKSGRITEAALDHPFLTTVGWVNAGELTDRHFLAEVPSPSTEPAEADRPLEEYRLAGYMTGDGSARSARFTVAEAGTEADFRVCAEATGFNISKTYRKRNWQTGEDGKAVELYVVGGMRKWLRESDMMHNSTDKVVPPWVFTSSQEAIANFVGAYFSCDGSINARGKTRDDACVEFYSVSRELLEGTQHLLLRLGIQSTLRLKNGRYKGERHVSWRLAITSQDDVAKFVERVPVYNTEKADRLSEWNYGRTEFSDPALFSDRVVSVDPVEMECRCLEVEEDHTFTSDDLVVHNSALLIDICIWLIVRYPNIRILWVAGNERIARRMVSSMKQILMTNQLLIDAFAGGEGFKPSIKAGSVWSSQEFTVATRTLTGIKAPTVTAIGRNGNLRSLDADLVIADDIEDHDSTINPSSREYTREWWAMEVESRKEEHTGLFFIGSRQHPDDLAGHLIEGDSYGVIVEHAHDPACTIPESKVSEHVDCMLFPELRSFKWLMDQRSTMDSSTGGRGIFDMVYQNMPHAKGLQVFLPEIIDPCLDATRAFRSRPRLDPSVRSYLIAGLDPSATGYQAAVLWQVTANPFMMYVVDLDNNKGGGVVEARRVISDWCDKYGLSHWVVEENLYHGGIVNDEKLRDFAEYRGIRLEPHITQWNKWDEKWGVTAFVDLFGNRQISLPWADQAAEVAELRRQFIYFSDATVKSRKGSVSDLVMASWFPYKSIRRLVAESSQELDRTYDSSFAWYSGSVSGTPSWARQRGYSRHR